MNYCDHCDRYADDTFTVACVHEHIGIAHLCQHHATALASDALRCRDCMRCADPHACVLHVIPVRSVA